MGTQGGNPTGRASVHKKLRRKLSLYSGKYVAVAASLPVTTTWRKSSANPFEESVTTFPCGTGQTALR
jgi:hypothetical protein